MKQTKHTPGPWHMHEEHSESSGGHEIHTDFDTGGDKGHYVVATTNIHSTVDLKTSEANARLIAAAPELLEACKVSEGYLQGLKSAKYATGGKFDGWDSRIMLLQSAIAKAEGK